jgi:flagellin-like hook-associated protein FlgL
MALSDVRNTTRLSDKADPDLWKLPVAASTKIWAGSLVMIDAGYAKPAASSTGKIIAGRAESTVDNTAGADGDLVIVVRRGCFKWTNSSAGEAITQADVGKKCYAVDDATVSKTDNGETRSEAGLVYQVESDGVFVLTVPGGTAGFTGGQDVIVALTDSTGGSGTHDDTLADGLNSTAPAAVTATALGDLVATQNTGWGANTEAGFDSISTKFDAAVTDITNLRATVLTLQSDAVIANQNISDLAQKVNEIIARLVLAGVTDSA